MFTPKRLQTAINPIAQTDHPITIPTLHELTPNRNNAVYHKITRQFLNQTVIDVWPMDAHLSGDISYRSIARIGFYHSDTEIPSKRKYIARTSQLNALCRYTSILVTRQGQYNIPLHLYLDHPRLDHPITAPLNAYEDLPIIMQNLITLTNQYKTHTLKKAKTTDLRRQFIMAQAKKIAQEHNLFIEKAISTREYKTIVKLFIAKNNAFSGFIINIPLTQYKNTYQILQESTQARILTQPPAT